MSSLELYETLLAKKRLRGLDDLYFFNKFIMEANPNRRKFIVPHVHRQWTDWYQNSTKRIKMILVPRGSFKSTFFTVGRTLQAIAKNRNERILIANATLANSQNFLSEIKDHIIKNEEYKMLYSQYKGKDIPMFEKNLRWNEDQIEVAGRDTGIREPTVTAVGVGGNLVSQHYSFILADDLVSDINSATRYQADKVIDWWKRSFSLLDPEGEMLIIGTRWSYYELYSYILEKLVDQVDTHIHSAYNSDGSLYFPERLGKEKLKELRNFHGSYFFSAFYLLDPVDEESALIKKDQILYYGDNEDQKLPKNLTKFSLCDPAVSQQENADYSTIVTIGVDQFDNWYVLEVRRERWTVGTLVDNLFSVYKLWKPNSMSIEVIGQAQGLMTPIRMEEQRRAEEGKPCYLPLVEIKSRPQYTKEMRIRSVLQPRFERGKVFIRRDMFDLEEELLKFPKAKHDDIIDPMTDMEEIAYAPNEEKIEVKTAEGKLSKLSVNLIKVQDHDEYMGEDW